MCLCLGTAQAQPTQAAGFPLARVKYGGGGDWYNDPSALANLIRFANRELPVVIQPRYADVEAGSPDLFRHPFLFLTGHGGIVLSASEIANLRLYLDRGGFLYIDDDYGLDAAVRALAARLYPDHPLQELPFSHPIYRQKFAFPDGLPKIHEHDAKPPQGFGIIRDGRLVLFYTYESNLSDGWADPAVHGLPETVRLQALRMGANLIQYALSEGGIR